ncbi:hypothetical protein J6590_083426 [Homalodisca vitripennis]|nr:hypothetical protein J6590_083426 [Homalodisca vitripennis]
MTLRSRKEVFWESRGSTERCESCLYEIQGRSGRVQYRRGSNSSSWQVIVIAASLMSLFCSSFAQMQGQVQPGSADYVVQVRPRYAQQPQFQPQLQPQYYGGYPASPQGQVPNGGFTISSNYGKK